MCDAVTYQLWTDPLTVRCDRYHGDSKEFINLWLVIWGYENLQLGGVTSRWKRDYSSIHFYVRQVSVDGHDGPGNDGSTEGPAPGES